MRRGQGGRLHCPLPPSVCDLEFSWVKCPAMEPDPSICKRRTGRRLISESAWLRSGWGPRSRGLRGRRIGPRRLLDAGSNCPLGRWHRRSTGVAGRSPTPRSAMRRDPSTAQVPGTRAPGARRHGEVLGGRLGPCRRGPRLPADLRGAAWRAGVLAVPPASIRGPMLPLLAGWPRPGLGASWTVLEPS